jgi:pyruvate,water dikinase
MIVALRADTCVEGLGGKAAGLVRLLRAGCDVPEAWCLRAGPIAHDALEEELRGFWRAHGTSPFAVRSSATAEDSEGASFAGIYETVLDVRTEDALIAAVRACRAAFHGAHAIAYRARRGIEERGDIALVLRRMVRPDVAGVMMTENPQRPFADEIVIDAAYGLGEGVVSGRVSPDHWVLDREARVIEARLGEKATRDGGEPVAPEDRARFCLDEGQRRALLALAARMPPRSDVEWAFEAGRLFVLQQRPMTGLPPRRPHVVHARAFGDEYLAGYATPLTRTLLVRWIRDVAFVDLARRMGRDDLSAMEPMVVHRGHHYLNGAWAMGLLRAAPRFARDAGPVAWFPPGFQARMREAPFDARAALGFLTAPLRDHGGALHRNVAELERHCLRIERTIAPRLTQDYAALSDAAWGAQLDEFDALGREHFRVIRWGLTLWGPMLHALLRATLRRFFDDDGARYEAIASGVTGTKTAEINRDVHALGTIARREGLDSPALAAALAGFLGRHGHRAPSRDITEPRWREAPEMVLALVRAQLARAEDAPSPDQLEARTRARREAAERTVLARAGLARPLVRALIAWTHAYTRYRENQRYFLDYVLAHGRALVLEQGRRLTARGLLASPEEVFLLEADELRALARGGTQVPALDERRAHARTNRGRMPATYLFDGVETEGEIAEGPRPLREAREACEGQGASRGVARGPARVVRDAEALARVRPGEILVVPTIDPAWTSVFPMIAGLVYRDARDAEPPRGAGARVRRPRGGRREGRDDALRRRRSLGDRRRDRPRDDGAVARMIVSRSARCRSSRRPSRALCSDRRRASCRARDGRG